VLFLEFLQMVFEKLGWHKPLAWLKLISVPLMVLGVILSTLHQSSLGSLYLIAPERLDAAWYSPLLPAFFFLSAVCVGLAVLSLVYLVMRFSNLGHRGALPLVFENRPENWFFGLEIALVLLPTLLLFRAHVRRTPDALYGAAVLWILGFITNRLNVAVTGMERSSGADYVPKWTEVAVTLFICALGFAIFRAVARHFVVFEAPAEQAEAGV
jgi:Ni/Fe-hydrogenase subunit HybB-like protein